MNIQIIAWQFFLKLLFVISVVVLFFFTLFKLKFFSFFKNLFVYSNTNKQKKLINPIENYHFDPRKKISLIRIAGRVLVLGITQESIQLITEIEDEEIESFSTLLKNEPQKKIGVRNKIRSKLEGMKPL